MKIVLALGATLALAGCASSGGRGWIPQGPGDYEKSAAPRAEPAPRAAAPRAAPASAGATGATSAPRAAAAVEPVAMPGGYTQATRYGDLLFVSGQIAMDFKSNQMVGASVEEQTRQVMENVRAILEAHRLTMANVVSVTVYLKDINQFRAMDEAYEAFFRGNLPSRSVVEANRLPRGALVEISVIAGR